MKIAVIKTGGKQYVVKEKDIVAIEKLKAKDGEIVKFNTLMIFNEKGEIELGTPILGEKVEARVLSTDKTKKISVIKFKNKIRYKKNVGHCQLKTKIQVLKIA